MSETDVICFQCIIMRNGVRKDSGIYLIIGYLMYEMLGSLVMQIPSRWIIITNCNKDGGVYHTLATSEPWKCVLRRLGICPVVDYTQ